MHKGEKPYECRLCGLKFAQQGNRDRHEKRKICLGDGDDEEDEEPYSESCGTGTLDAQKSTVENIFHCEKV